MSQTTFANWVHLDLKGIMPAHGEMESWIDRLADMGFNGIVFEYEDRLPWRTWPDTFRPGYSLEQWQRLWQRCRERQLEIVPLIQVQGHLEWLLKRERYAHWREKGCFNELCPQQPEAIAAVQRWIDEVIELHPDARHLHIGGDETWNLAICPDCQAIAAREPDGKMAIYIAHVSAMARYVLERGRTPMIWADMFWRENRLDLADRLPEQTVLCDWQYSGSGPWETTAQLATSGRPVFGASGIRCGFDLREAQSPITPRLDNVLGWHRDKKQTAGLLHTTWARTRSLLPLYGPWHGWLPAFIAAGHPQRWPSHPLAAWTTRLDEALVSQDVKLAMTLRDELQQVHFDAPLDEQCRHWWVIALQGHVLLVQSVSRSFSMAALESVHHQIGVDPDFVNHGRVAARRIAEQIDQWERDVRQFFADHQLDSVDEYLASRVTQMRRLLSADWARDIIEDRPPVSAR